MLTLIPPVHRATHRIGLYLEAGTPDSLSQGESHILALLASASPRTRARDRGAMTIAELHQGLAHKRSTLTSILNRLADRGLVTREVGRADRRTFVVATTSKGRGVAYQILKRLRD